jgi:uncharacterized protein with ParB-like and HNH nuclease domain
MKAPSPKPAPYRPDKRTIGELLSTTSPAIIVPAWQRSYSWTESHVETFWNDLTEFDRRHPGNNIDQREYFIGSVVIVATSSNEHLLLDGQQRLATAVILLSVIREKIKTYKADAATRLQAKYLADFDDAKGEYVYKLTLNNYDRDFFKRKVLESRDSSYKEPAPELSSHFLIEKARAYFLNAFDEKYNSFPNPGEAFNWSIRIQNVLLNHMSVVAVTSTDEDSAAEVFETLNDRGIGLSTPDLLRNLVIRRAATTAQDEVIELWSEVLEFDTDTEIKAFLRHFWISRHGDVKTQRLYREIKDHIVGENIQSLDFSRELKDSSVVYKDIVQAKDDNAEVASLLRAIDELGAAVLYPVVLSIMECAEQENREDFLEAVVHAYVRHSVIGQLENSKLENVIHRLAAGIRGAMKLPEASKILAEFAPDDDAFTAAFQRVSISRTATQRYLLREIELKKRTTEELGVNPPSKVHVEHIYPQTPTDGHKWKNHAQMINRLGNLSLLSGSLNSSIRNSIFDKKLPSYAKSELLLTKELVGRSQWDAAAVEDRQKGFSELAVGIWPMYIYT